MIKINVATHTNLNGSNGVEIPAGSVLDVNPHFMSFRTPVDSPTDVQHDIAFDVKIYKSLSSYENGDNTIISSEMKEYNISFKALDVDIQSLTSVSDLLDLLKDHIENGDSDFPGIGVGNAEIIWPYSE